MALQPAPRSDRFVAPVVNEAPVAPVVEEIAATSADTNLMMASITVPTVPKPVAPKPIVAEGNTPSTPTTIKGLQELVSVALTRGMTAQELDQLIVRVGDHGTLIIPDTLRTPNGQPDTMSMLATLVDTTNPTTPTLTRDVGNTYVVRPGDSLASIAVKYYGSTDAVNDIFLYNKDRLSDPDQLRVGQTIFLPLLLSAAPICVLHFI